MGDRPPAGFTWPVPPEELSGVPVLVLDWTTEGRLTVREEKAVSGASRPAAPPGLRVAAPTALPRRTASPREPRPLAITHVPAAETTRIVLPQPVRERVTWLGIGMLAGLVIAASMMPDADSLSSSSRRQAEGTPQPLPLGAPAQPAAAAATVPARRAAPGPARVPDAKTEPLAASSRLAMARGDEAPARVSTPLPITRTVGVAAPPAPRATPPAPAAGAVLREVHRYEAALSRLDATAAHAARPGVDREAFARAFTGLREQRLRLDGCTVAMPGESATVSCRGRLDYRPRLGDHTTRTSRGVWRFTLARDTAGWVIEDVHAPAGVLP